MLLATQASVLLVIKQPQISHIFSKVEDVSQPVQTGSINQTMIAFNVIQTVNNALQ